MTTWGRVLGGLVIFVVLVVLVVLLACAGWVGAQKYRESVEQRASLEAGRGRPPLPARGVADAPRGPGLA